MAEQQLSLEWLGGATERRLRVARPAYAELHDELPWDSFDLARADDATEEPLAYESIERAAIVGDSQ